MEQNREPRHRPPISIVNRSLTKEQRQCNGAKAVFLINGGETTEHPEVTKNMKLDTDLTNFTNINSNWTIDLNAKCKRIKLLAGNRRENLYDLGSSDAFLGTPSVT